MALIDILNYFVIQFERIYENLIYNLSLTFSKLIEFKSLNFSSLNDSHVVLRSNQI